MRLVWTEEEISILKKYYPEAKPEDLEKLLPRFSIEKIRIKANRLGIKKKKIHRPTKNSKMLRWTEDEVKKLELIYSKTPNEELLEEFSRFDLKKITYKARSLGLKKIEEVNLIDKQRRIDNLIGEVRWTQEENNIIRENYEVLGSIGVQKMLPNKRSLTSIRTKAQRLGVNTSNEAAWSMTDIEMDNKDIFSIKATFERIDRP